MGDLRTGQAGDGSQVAQAAADVFVGHLAFAGKGAQQDRLVVPVLPEPFGATTTSEVLGYHARLVVIQHPMQRRGHDWPVFSRHLLQPVVEQAGEQHADLDLVQRPGPWYDGLGIQPQRARRGGRLTDLRPGVTLFSLDGEQPTHPGRLGELGLGEPAPRAGGAGTSGSGWFLAVAGVWIWV